MDGFKQELWDTTSIGIPHLDVEANDAVILGFMVAQFITEVSCRDCYTNALSSSGKFSL